MTERLARVHAARQYLWILPALAGLAVTGYLSWGAWVTARDSRLLTLSHVWWRAGLAPSNDMTLLVTALVWAVAWAAFWWPRRKQNRTVGLITIAAMVAVGA